MKLEKQSKIKTRSKKRLGRGMGSGKGGHTASRGSKGQKARSKVNIWFEGGQLQLTKRLPFQRGKGRFKSLVSKPIIINIKHLNLLPAKSKVNLDTLVKHGIVGKQDVKKAGVKILGEGKLEKALTVELPTSKSAAKAIIKAGGKVTLEKPKKTKKKAVKKTKPKPRPSGTKKK